MKKHTKPYILLNCDKGTIQVYLSYRVFTEDDWFFAECPELRLIDQGTFQREAVENLSEMVKASLIEAIETGNFDGMLKYLGFKKRSQNHSEIKYFSSIKNFQDLHPLIMDVTIPKTPEMATR